MSSAAVHASPLHETRSFTCSAGYQKGLVRALQSAASTIRPAAELEADDVLYKKARIYMRSRPKRVLFKVNHRLYQSGNLEEDVKRLRNDRYEGVEPPASIIWGERYDQDVLQSSKTLNEDNFWPFVHSVAWSKFSSIRVTEGALLDSLLFAYFSLVQDGRLVSYVTDVYQENASTSNQKKQQKENETMKITFTYYAPSLKTLSNAIYRHRGSRVSIDDLAEQNGSRLKLCKDSPDVTIDFAWSGDNDCPPALSRLPRPTPANPPNSPTPSASPTQTLLMKKRKDRSLLGSRRSDLVKYPASYYNLPLMLRNRITLGRKCRGDDGMAVEGKSLRCRRDDTGQYTPASALYFTRDAPKTSGYKSSYHGVRESLSTRHQDLRLPSLPQSPKKNEAPATLDKHGDSPSPLHSCLASPSHQRKDKEKHQSPHESSPLQRPDSKRRLMFSPNLEYISVVQRVTPGAATPKSPGPGGFDTKKLFINWSLEKIRQARRRGKMKRKGDPSPEDILQKLELQETDKNYVLGKFLADQDEHSKPRCSKASDECPLHTIKDIQCDQCRREITRHVSSPLPILTKHSDVRKLRFASATGPTTTERSSLTSTQPGFADTVCDFKHGCFASTQHFIIRKEQITTSKDFLTATSVTINKLPGGGFMSWQYKTDEATLDK